MTMPSRITAGVDTHLDIHVAATLDERGGLLGIETFATTPAGYQQLLDWLSNFGAVELAGVEGTGSHGAGLTRFLHANEDHRRRSRTPQPTTLPPTRQERPTRRDHRPPSRAVR